MSIPENAPAPLSLGTRLWFAWVCLFRVLFDPLFAARAWAARAAPKVLSARPDGAAKPTDVSSPPSADVDRKAEPRNRGARMDAAKGLQLLALLQRDGRFIDFLEQDVTRFTDEEVGAAARIVHEGCRKVLHRVTSVSPLRSENEGTQVTIDAGFSPAEISLVGNVQGAAPYRGTLRHRGWRTADLNLPETLAGHDLHVVAPAEVEL